MTQDPEAILAELRACPLLDPDFPKRASVSIELWAGLAESERRDISQISSDAMNLVRAVYRPWENGIRALGTLRHKAAIPLLSELWRNCALVPVRNGAGHALLSIADPAAYDVLEAQIGDRERISTYLGVRAIFRRDPFLAFERLSPLLAATDITSATIGHETLSLFAPSLFGPDGTPSWSDPNILSWLRQDPRWFRLCAALLQDHRHGEAARAALRYADPDHVLPAIEAAQAKRPPAPAPIARARGDLLTRYKSGDHLGTWREARIFPAIAGELRAEILALADETIARAARNIDLISERLQIAGWQTLVPMRTAPEPGDAAQIAAIERLTGASLPPSLAAFWRIVGGVCWVWDYDRDDAPAIAGLPLANIDTDALFIESCGGVAAYCLEKWEEQKDVIHPELIGPFQLDLSPDHLHKMNVSGGPPYGVELPFQGADPIFRQEDRHLPFVNYLRDCLAWAGFPRLRHHPDQAAARRFVDMLGRDTEPF